VKRPSRDVARIIDANINRAVEGVRVMEEAARMVFDDAPLTASLKDLRHDIARIARMEPGLEAVLIKSRGSDRDVLRDGVTESETSRTSMGEIVRANAGRVREAVRVIEEYIKLSYPELSGQCKSARFRLYDLEKELILTIEKTSFLSPERLRVLALAKCGVSSSSTAETVARATGAGAMLVCLGDASVPDGVFLGHLEAAVEMCGNTGAGMIVVDRLDCTLAVGAGGVCVGVNSLPVAVCRQVGGESLAVGVSLAYTDNGRRCGLQGADFAVVTLPNPDDSDRGGILQGLGALATTESVPIIVTECAGQHLRDVAVYAGVAGIAVDCSGAYEKRIKSLLSGME
jgi:thiamine-phosphate pyrophosphorylase